MKGAQGLVPHPGRSFVAHYHHSSWTARLKPCPPKRASLRGGPSLRTSVVPTLSRRTRKDGAPTVLVVPARSKLAIGRTVPLKPKAGLNGPPARHTPGSLLRRAFSSLWLGGTAEAVPSQACVAAGEGLRCGHPWCPPFRKERERMGHPLCWWCQQDQGLPSVELSHSSQRQA